MTPTRTPWWAALALSLPMAWLAAGCGEPTPEPSSAPTPSASTPALAPKTEAPKPEPTKTEAPKPAPKAEAPKTEPAKTEMPKIEAPKVEAPKVEAPKVEAPKADAPKAAAAVKLSDEEIAAIRKLPKEDQDAAIKQAVCPVSGDHLGAMEAPVKVTAEGRTFFLCCKGCKKEVEEHPKDVIAKLPK